jgi:hypothetical protein
VDDPASTRSRSAPRDRDRALDPARYDVVPIAIGKDGAGAPASTACGSSTKRNAN